MLTGVQKLINIKIAKAYRTVSNEELCIITGLIRIHIEIKESAELYKIVKRDGNMNLQIEYHNHL